MSSFVATEGVAMTVFQARILYPIGQMFRIAMWFRELNTAPAELAELAEALSSADHSISISIDEFENQN
jgi:hypothetical protein